MEEVILEAVRRMNNYLKDIVTVEILDTQMSRKYPDNYAPSGYLGVSILITCNKKQHRVFLKYEESENMLTYSSMMDGFLGHFVKDDLEQILKNYYRKKKLEQLNERIEAKDN